MGNLFNCAFSHITEQTRKLLKDNVGNSTVDVAFKLSGLGWTVVVTIMVLDSSFSYGYRSFGANILEALTVF